MTKTNQQIAMQVSRRTIVANILLAGFKLFAGIYAHSAAMVSDAVHTLSDVLSTIVVMVGVQLAYREADHDHPYGHERLECVAAVILSVMLLATGLGIGWAGVQKIIAGSSGALAAPGVLAVVAAAVSIVVKEAMYWYTRHAAKKISSSALMADAWHHRSDAFSSIGSLLAIVGARLGWPLLDPLACVLICCFIVKAAVDVFRSAISKLTDRACDAKMEDAIRQAITDDSAAVGVDQLQTRLFGDKAYVDVEISVDGALPLTQAHQVAEQVHELIEARFPQVKHCMVHVNPWESAE